MANKRDIVSEIKDRETRLKKENVIWEEVTDVLDNILDSLTELEKIKNNGVKEELLRGLLVRMVASMEGFFRVSIKKIIDSNKKYKSNISSLNIKNNIDVNIILSISNNFISLGDIISHFVSINNLSDIVKILSTLLSINFLKSIKLVNIEELDNQELGRAFPNIYVDLDMLFRERHIYAHEIASHEKIDLEYIEIITQAGFMFLYASAEIIESCIMDDSHFSEGKNTVIKLENS